MRGAFLAAAVFALAPQATGDVHFLPAGRVATRDMRTVPPIDLAPGVHVRTVVGAEGSFSLGEFEPGAAAVLHHHTREQADIALDGVLDMTIANRVEPLGPGAGVIVPPDVAHSIRNNTSRTRRVIEFHTVRRPDLVPPRPAVTFPASGSPVDTPGGRAIVAPLEAPASASADKRAGIAGETCTMAWRIVSASGRAADLNAGPPKTERFFYVMQGDATLLSGGRLERVTEGTLIVVPAGFTQHVQLKASGTTGVALAEFALTSAPR